MVVGLLVTAIVSSTTVCLALVATSSPLWIVLLAYPLTGTLVMLFGLASVSFYHWLKPESSETQAHFPVQRNTTPTVATSTLTSVANDNVRS